MTEHLYQLSAYDATAGVIVRDGIVVEAAPFFAWMEQMEWEQARQWPNLIEIIKVY